MSTFLVTGITGTQGSSAARALLARGHTVVGSTRDPAAAKAQPLAALGVRLVSADFARPETLVAAMRGVDGVFAMSTPFEAGEAAETAQGEALVDAGVAAGVRHFVYTSVASADKATGIPHFDSKYEVERHLVASGLNHTIVAPAYFMENLFFPNTLGPLKNDGVYASPLPPDVKLTQVAARNIGEVVATVLHAGSPHFGRRYDLAGDDLSSAEQAAKLSKKLGRPIGTFQVPMEAIRAFSEDMAIMYQWFADVGYDIDRAALRKTFPDVAWLTFDDWLATVEL